jgi:hypothetical protein
MQRLLENVFYAIENLIIFTARLRAKQSKAACRCPNLRDFAYCAHSPFVLCVVSCTGVWTRFNPGPTIYGRMGCGTNVEFSKLVELYVDRIVRISFAHCFDFSCLSRLAII